jgi:hypothetical protein
MAEKLWFIIPELILFAGVVVWPSWACRPPGGARRPAARVVPSSPRRSSSRRSSTTRSTSGGGRPAHAPDAGQVRQDGRVPHRHHAHADQHGLIDRRMEADVEKGRIGFDPHPRRTGRVLHLHAAQPHRRDALLQRQRSHLAVPRPGAHLACPRTSWSPSAGRSPRRRRRPSSTSSSGAMSAAMFLYGFALLYGSTGTIVLVEMRRRVRPADRRDGPDQSRRPHRA